MRNFKFANTPIEIIYDDAAKFNFKNEAIFFMFNPFKQKTLGRVLINIKKSLKNNPRRINIIYYNPIFG